MAKTQQLPIVPLKTQQFPSPRPTERIASIDVFRGLTMLVMLFVNDIGDYGVTGAPTWLYHMADLHERGVVEKVDGMTLPDVVFPTFLFIVGLTIPAALERRIARGNSRLKLSLHIVVRSLELILIGVCMANMGHVRPLGGVSPQLWRLLLFPSMILLWNRYPPSEGALRWLFIMLRVLGAALLIYLLVIFRQEINQEIVWLRPRWWGILGLIGWAYLVAAFVWLAGRDLGAAIMGALGLLVAIRLGDDLGFFPWWRQSVIWLPQFSFSGGLGFEGWSEVGINNFVPSPGSTAAHAAAVLAGMAIATLFRPISPAKTPWSRIAWILVFAAGFAAAGYLVRPLLGLGINKNRSTPAWVLDCSAIACVVYAFLYWLIDFKKIDGWTFLIAPAGSNTLLMYVLPWIVVFALAAAGINYSDHFNEGWLGVTRAATMAFCLVALTGLLTRCRVRLQL